MAKENNLTITHPDLCKEWHPTLNGDLKPEDFTAGSEKKIYWLLPYDDQRTGKHFDFVWRTQIYSRTNGSGCPYLTRSPKAWKGYNDLATVRPDLISEWDFEKNEKGPECYTQCSSKKVFWKKEYFDQATGKFFVFTWSDSISHRAKENRGCPYLAPNPKVWKGFNDLATTHSSIAKQWNYEKNNLTPQEVTAGSSKKVYSTCEKGHTYKTFIYARLKNGCPYCATSSSEKIVHNILDRNNIEFKIEKRFVEEIKNSPYDIFLNKENLFIELDGKQHFKEGSIFESIISFEKRIIIDNEKNKYAFKNDIPLLRIPYTYFTDELKMEALLMDFIRTRVIPKEIIDFYREYEFSNYAELAEKYNESLKLKVS